MESGFVIHWPAHEHMIRNDAEMSCDWWPDGRLSNCEINGRRVNAIRYRQVRDGHKKAPGYRYAIRPFGKGCKAR